LDSVKIVFLYKFFYIRKASHEIVKYYNKNFVDFKLPFITSHNKVDELGWFGKYFERKFAFYPALYPRLEQKSILKLHIQHDFEKYILTYFSLA